MKNIYKLIFGLAIILAGSPAAHAQSLAVLGSSFLTIDSIGFTYDSPSFTDTDWIGIYKVGETPGGPASSSWGYIPAASGTIYLDAPDDAGSYIAYLLCCDGYDILATSAEFSIMLPSIASSSVTYLQGDPMEFTFTSPIYSSSDWIGIYTMGTIPGSANPSIDWKYIPASTGTVTFTTNLTPGWYDAILLCCDGYRVLATCTFEVRSTTMAFVVAKAQKFAAGAPIEIQYNDPAYAAGDWMGIYFEGDDPALVTSAVWLPVTVQSGTLSFAGTLSGGNYFAVLFCCNSSETEYARSGIFQVEAGASGMYVKTSASVYPEGRPILVNYRDMDWVSNDWLGIYKKGESPGGPASTLWAYVPSDSGTVAFNDPLLPGEYVVYLLCCDGYNIKAKANFKVADASTPSIVASAMTFAEGDSITFYYNSPSYVNTDWIGIYHPGNVPGEISSITWMYLPVANGSMVFHYPDDQDLTPGEYWAGLFCCDWYDLYAQASFVVTAGSAGVETIETPGGVRIFPNPTNGLVRIMATGDQLIREIEVYGMTGQVFHREKIDGAVQERNLDLKHLDKGVYFVSTLTQGGRTTRKLVIQ